MNEMNIANKIIEIYRLERVILNVDATGLTTEEQDELIKDVFEKTKQVKALRRELVELFEALDEDE